MELKTYTNTDKDILPQLRLMLNIEHPALEECWIEGYLAGEGDKAEEDNPYTDASIESEHWLEGWSAGFYGEEALYHAVLARDFQNVAQADGGEKNKIIQITKVAEQNILEIPRRITHFVKIASAIAATFLISYGVVDFIA